MATVTDVLKVATAELGTKESPANSNMQKYGAEYGLNGQPWCVIFLWWVFKHAGASELFLDGGKTAVCSGVEKYANRADVKRWKTGSYKVGDLVIFDFNHDKVNDHIGIVCEVCNGYYKCIEGNTSPNGNGSQSNGGMVCKRIRYASEIKGAYRPAYVTTGISYKAHCQTYGWLPEVKDFEQAGKIVNPPKRLEAITIDPHGVKLKARAHCQTYGWSNWVEFDKPTTFGTTGQSKRLEAIEIVSLTDGVKVEYQAYMEGIGWGHVYKNGRNSTGYAGTVGQARRIEALKIKLT